MNLLRLAILTVAAGFLFTTATGSALAKAKHPRPTHHSSTTDYPPHYQGWLCIHSREAQSWSENTGNGYYGGLQMTYGWANVVPGRASDYSELQQMWWAENESRKYGFSYSWMKGQWPNTYPPCAGYFS